MPRVMRLRWLRAAKGHQPPEVALHQRQARAVEDADDSQRNQPGRQRPRLHGEEPNVEAKHGVEAQLAGDNHGQGNRRLAEGVRQPSVQREDRNLDGKGEEEGEGDPAHRPGREVPVGDQDLERREVEAARLRVEP